MSPSDRRKQRGAWWTLMAVFVVAVAFNHVWELAQAPLYAGMGDFSRMLWHCFVPSLGDGVDRAAHFCSRLAGAASTWLVRATGGLRIRLDAHRRTGDCDQRRVRGGLYAREVEVHNTDATFAGPWRWVDAPGADAPNEPVTVELTPRKGEFTFACGMNMLNGKLIVE